MKVSEELKLWYKNGGKEKISMYMVDVDGIFTSNKGGGAGVYGAFVLLPDGREASMYIGETGNYGRGFRDRFIEHMRNWIEEPRRYTGLTVSELEDGYKYLVRILAQEPEHDKRYELEQLFVKKYKPYLQTACYPKSIKTNYTGCDLCIIPKFRRRAFLDLFQQSNTWVQIGNQ